MTVNLACAKILSLILSHYPFASVRPRSNKHGMRLVQKDLSKRARTLFLYFGEIAIAITHSINRARRNGLIGLALSIDMLRMLSIRLVPINFSYPALLVYQAAKVETCGER